MKTLLRLAPCFLVFSLTAAFAADPAPPAGATAGDDASIREVLKAVSRHQLRPLEDGDYTPVATLAALQSARPPAGISWSYPWGVTLYGTLRSVDFTGDAEVEQFALEHNRIAARDYAFLNTEREKIGAADFKAYKSKIAGLLSLGSLDSCGAMGAQMLEGILRHPEQETAEQKIVVARIADWITHGQDRLPDGTLWRAHSNGGANPWKPGTIWMDDLYMACPFLVRWAKYSGDTAALNDAGRQIIQMAARLQDTDGVWYHAYFVNEQQHSPIKWGRANGWGVVATVEVLSALPEDHPARPQLLAILRRQLEGLKRLQAPSGMWRQVLDHPELWEETSCTAMFAYGYARAVNRGWIDRSNLAVARKAFAGLEAHITPDGAVNGTCEGTNISLGIDYYAQRLRPDDDLHGRGVVLLAGAEILAAARSPLPPAPVVAEAAVILTPPAPAAPRINGARVFGVRPGHPFLFQIPATGDRPMIFSATGLPDGLRLDGATGLITGSVAAPGSFAVTLAALNAQGVDTKPLRIVAGEAIALTPAMGWNSWNSWAKAVDQAKVLASARAMAASGLKQHGWSYVNIDDTWQGARAGGDHALQANEKFPDLKALAAEIHSLGLKIGIYSTPWVTSYAGYAGGSAENPAGTWQKFVGPKQVNKNALPWAIGQYSFAAADARQWADWGIDYLKYDWNPNAAPETAEMAQALRASGRDIILSLSNSAPFAGAADWARLANSWRTTGDIRDTWASLQKIGFSQAKWRPFAGPGHWNDPDMLIVGNVGWGPKLHATRLTPNEQYTHISLWCLLSAPLLIGCPIEQMDAFTLSLLTNDEVLAIDQDELGREADQAVVDGTRQVWVKELADGSRAVGLFNLGDEAQEVSVTWAQLGLAGPQRARDLWRQQELGTMADRYTVSVGRHGVALVRLWPAAIVP
jgi:alpha-galactosidase